MALTENFLRRRAERKSVQLPVVLTIEGQPIEHRSMTVDISSQGLRLRTIPSITQGQVVRLHLAAAPQEFQPARVAWLGSPDSEQAGQAGFEFLVSSGSGEVV